MTKQKHRRILHPAAALREVVRGFHLEVDPHGRGLCVAVGGVGSIVAFSTCEVELRCGRRRVYVRGELLELAVYENRTVSVIGQIREVGFTG